MQDKRRHPRFDVNLPVILRCKGAILPAVVLNISYGGMLIKVDAQDIFYEAPVEVIFDLDNEKRDISMRGQIKRVDKIEDASDIGIEFTNYFSTGHKVVREFIGEHLH